jgi:carbamoyltransferase
VVAAVEEERFRRIKHWSGLPTEAMRWCLRDAGLDWSQVDAVAINRDTRAQRWARLAFALRHRPSLALMLRRLANRRRAANLAQSLSARFEGWRGQVHAVEHHEAHLASAFEVCPAGEAVCVSVDGFGDFSSSAWGLGRRDRGVSVEGRVLFPHSLGIFYSAITQFLGFPHYGDEYKMMGLAPYGKPRYLETMRRILRLRSDGGFELNLDCFRHHRSDVHYTWDDCAPQVGEWFDRAGMSAILGEPRRREEPLTQHHRDVACSAQAAYEEALFSLLRSLHSRHPLPDLALAGGCALNSVANGKVNLRTPFKTLHLPLSPGDAGGAVGAALCVARRQGSTLGAATMPQPYLGPQFDETALQQCLQQYAGPLAAAGCRPRRVESDQALCDEVAAEIEQGKVVGWFQGRVEWGPRALGNRSILADPRRADMKDILNSKIKRRESFRPFAPSILREAVAEWFEQDADVPGMMQVFVVKAERREQIPAVTHVDGSGRLQTVHAQSNPLYHQLISAFALRTGVPMLLNTSFNENEPVVCQPSEAMECFLRTAMDVLVLGPWLLCRSTSDQGVRA